MSDLPYMRFYIGDHVRDTHHLTLEQEGAYMRLLFTAWHIPGCTIPDDPQWIIRRLHISREEYERAVVPVLEEFFTRDGGRLWQARQRKEYAAAVTSRERQSRAGKTAARQRWKPEVFENAELD